MRDSERDELFARARRAATPSEADRRRVRSALATRLGATAVGAVGTTAATAAASAGAAGGGSTVGSGLTLLGAVKAAVVVASVAGALAASLHMRATGVTAGPLSSGTASALASRQNDVDPIVHPKERETIVAAQAAHGEETTTLSVPPQSRASSPASAHPLVDRAPGPLLLPPSASLTPPASSAIDAEEVALMAGVQAALRNGDPVRALALVDEHQRRFPDSRLSPEREGARVLAECTMHTQASPDDARAIGRRFLRAHPLSPLGGRVRLTCGIAYDEH